MVFAIGRSQMPRKPAVYIGDPFSIRRPGRNPLHRIRKFLGDRAARSPHNFQTYLAVGLVRHESKLPTVGRPIPGVLKFGRLGSIQQTNGSSTRYCDFPQPTLARSHHRSKDDARAVG